MTHFAFLEREWPAVFGIGNAHSVLCLQSLDVDTRQRVGENLQVILEECRVCEAKCKR